MHSRRCERNGQWYRAIIHEVDSLPGRATVIFVDYAQRDSINLRDIRLGMSHEEIPVQAIRCKLFNICVPGSGNAGPGVQLQWPRETINFLRQMIENEEFVLVNVKENGPPLEVVMSLRNSTDVSKELLRRGLAEYIKNPKTLYKERVQLRKQAFGR